MNGRKGNKFLLTQSLLSSWQYALKSGEWGELLSTLRREKKPQSKAMYSNNIPAQFLIKTRNGKELWGGITFPLIER